ncbi:MAG TPA: ASCH domain-containing protein [Candidatus Paceibacterota bacterium]
MKAVKFQPDLAQLVIDGKKTTTWRMFDDKNLQTGDEIELVNKATGEVFGHATISWVTLKYIKDLDEVDWEGHERFPNEEAMYATYRGYYAEQEVGPETIVKIIHFNLIKK